jgi:hypothetical protein
MKLCLIGSTRFMDLYIDFNQRLTRAGHIVYSVAMISSSQRGHDSPNITDLEKTRLDLVHLKKILESEAVVVVSDATGYIGDSTRRELDWAALVDKDTYWPIDMKKLEGRWPYGVWGRNTAHPDSKADL